MSKPDRKHGSFFLMHDGQLQNMLPYETGDEAQAQDASEDFIYANIEKLIHPERKSELDSLADGLPQVFLYHLGWSGDVEKAQWLTEQTILVCGQWLASFNPEKMSSLVWLLKVALLTRRTRQNAMPSREHRLESEGSSSLQTLAKLTWFSEWLAQQPNQAGEVFVLAGFVGINLKDTAAVVGMDIARAGELLEAGLRSIHYGTTTVEENLEMPFMAAIGELSAILPSDPDWLEKVHKQLLSIQARPLPAWRMLLAGPTSRFRVSWKRNFSWGLPLLAALVLVGIASGWWTKNQTPTPTQTPLAVAPVATQAPTRRVENTPTRHAENTPTPGVILPASTDSLYWAGQDGAIYRYLLADGTTRRLTDPGVYTPQVDDVAQVSPDGRFLALYSPKSSTLLVDLQNGEVIHLPQTDSLAWKLDGSQAAFTMPGNPGKIFVLEKPFVGQPVLLADLPDEDLVSLAWSPDGSQLSVLAIPTKPSTAPTMTPSQKLFSIFYSSEQRNIYVIHSGSASVKLLASVDLWPGFGTNPSDLAWTVDGQQIWYRSALVAVRVQDGAVLPLIAENTDSVPDDVRHAMIYPKTGTSRLLAKYLISPDGLLLTYNPAWMVFHNLSNITMQRYTGKEIWEAQMPVSVYSLAWTQESNNLLAGAQINQPGPIFRLNALTGEKQQLVDDVYWIGVKSDLQARSMDFVPQVDISLATGDTSAGWVCNESLAMYSVDRICFPPYWDQGTLPEGSNANTVPVYISNLVFSAPYGWATQIPGSIRIGIFNYDYWPDMTLLSIPESLPAEKGVLWEPITIDGIRGVHLLVGYSILRESISINGINYSDLWVGHSGQTEIILPLPSGEYLNLIVTTDVADGFNNPAVQRILQSIVIKK